MPSRRKLKKGIKSTTNDIIEEGFVESINGDAKEQDKMDKIIDDVIDYRFELLSKVSNYPRNSKRAEIKKYFHNIKEELQKHNSDFSKKIGHVS